MSLTARRDACPHGAGLNPRSLGGLTTLRKSLSTATRKGETKSPINSRHYATCARWSSGVGLRPTLRTRKMPKPMMRSRPGFEQPPSSSNCATNVRAAVRYKLHAEVVFHWLDTNGETRESRGRTRDVSPKGAFVFASECPPKGTPVEMDIDLPALSGEPRTLRIRADGCVLRVEPTSALVQSSGFAAVCERVMLCQT